MQKSGGENLTDELLERDRTSLIAALLSLRNKAELGKFLEDLCTPVEIRALAERWRVARLLDEGRLSYRDIREETGVSLATIGRVARFLTQEPNQGYAIALKRLRELSSGAAAPRRKNNT